MNVGEYTAPCDVDMRRDLAGNGYMGKWHTGESRWTGGWSLLVVLLAIGGLMVPAYGPALEPGYAEMLPGHTHVFFNRSNANHSHSYVTDGVGADTTGEGRGVLALPGVDTYGSMGIVVATAFAALALGAALIAPVTTIRVWVFRQLALAANTIVPTAPPPKAHSL